MGCLGIYFCFDDFKPINIAISSFIINIISVGLLIWGLFEIIWFRRGTKILFYISFIFLDICLVSSIMMIIILYIRNTSNYIIINKIGKILCIIISLFCTLSFILLLIGEILLIKDHVNWDNEYDDMKESTNFDLTIHSKNWAAAIIPGIFSIITSLFLLLSSSILYKIFNENITTNIKTYKNDLIKNQKNSINNNNEKLNELKLSISPLSMNTRSQPLEAKIQQNLKKVDNGKSNNI